MQRQCPGCGSFDVRRSSARDRGEVSRTVLRSRYRCRDCTELFWVVSSRAYRVAGVLFSVTLLVSGVVALLLAGFGD